MTEESFINGFCRAGSQLANSSSQAAVPCKGTHALGRIENPASIYAQSCAEPEKRGCNEVEGFFGFTKSLMFKGYGGIGLGSFRSKKG